MVDKVTMNQLRELRLPGMVQAIQEQDEHGALDNLPFDERFALLVEAEWLSRKNRRINRFLSQAAFREPASIENIEWQDKHGITKADVLRLTESGWLRKKQNCIFSGPTGVGKTYIACAVGASLCRINIPVRYFRLSNLFLKISDSQTERRYSAFRKKLASVPLLILDDWGLKKFSSEETEELMELFEQRYGNSSTLICSQIPVSAWHDLFPNRTLADAILDRIVYTALKYSLTGESMRKILAARTAE